MFFNKAVVLLLALPISTVAQTPCISSLNGRVVDAEGTPLLGAAILLTPGASGLSTGADGRYEFNGLCPGTYTVKVQYLGHKTASVTISIQGRVSKDFVMYEDLTELGEVVIHHHDAAHTEHATNFVEIDERRLAEMAGKTLGETLREIPGVTSLQSGPGVFKPVIHGLSGQRLLILNHGIRQEGQQWGAEHAPEIDPFIASNLVVIKDASAIKYGADALGGVIVVNPAQLPESDELGGAVTTVVQSNGRSGTLSGMLEGGIRKGSGWGWRVQGTARRGGDFSTADYNLTNTGVKELDFSVASGYHSKTFGVDLFFSRFHSTVGILRGIAVGNQEDLANAMERDVPLYTSDFSYDIKEPRQEISHNLLKINGHITGRAGEWRAQYGFQQNDRKEFDLRIGDLPTLPAIDLELNTHSADVQWETHHSELRTFSLGVNGMYQSNRNVPGTRRIPFIPNFRNISGGLFATAKFFVNQWTFDGGVRYDYRDYSVKGFDLMNKYYTAAFDFNNASASLGVMRRMGAHHLKLNVSTAWRPPHVSELYSGGTHQSVAAIEYGLMLDHGDGELMEGVHIAPEQSLKTVAGYEIETDKLRVEVNPFVNYIFNYVYLRPGGITRNISGVSPYFWYDRTDAFFVGADFHVVANVSKQLAAVTRISLINARDVGNDRYFLFVPSNRYFLDFRYEPGDLGGMTNTYFQVGGQYVARQTRAPRVITVSELNQAEQSNTNLFEEDDSIFDFAQAPDGYFLLNAALGVSVQTEKTQYDFRISVENALNQKYREYTNRFRYFADDIGRNLTFSVKCIF